MAGVAPAAWSPAPPLCFLSVNDSRALTCLLTYLVLIISRASGRKSFFLLSKVRSRSTMAALYLAVRGA